MMRRNFVFLSALGLLVAAACGPGQDADSQEAEVWRIENPDLGLAIAEMVPGFEIVTNDAFGLEFANTAAETPGKLWFEIGPTENSGINLVEIVNAQRAVFEALPDGNFKGNRELMMTDGRPAFYSRGQFSEDGVVLEEIRISALHPIRNATLQIFYRYPETGEENSKERLNDLLLLIGEVEGFKVDTSATETATDSETDVEAPAE